MSTSLQTANSVVFSVESSRAIMDFAAIMAKGNIMLPEHLRDNQPACMAVAMQSSLWNMNPFAVAQKTHLVGGTLGYEAQLVNAVVTSSRAVKGRFHYEYGGNWDDWKYQPKNISNNPQKPKFVNGASESGLWCRVGAILNGEESITWGEKIFIEHVKVRNSPLWQTNPKQQIAYLGVKYWSRLYCPEVLLGVYTPDELQENSEYDQGSRVEKVINPEQTIDDIFNDKKPAAEKEISDVADLFELDPEPEAPSAFDLLLCDIDAVSELNELDDIMTYIAKNKSEFIPTELNLLRVKTQKKKNEFKDLE
jgi:hypothetical protein